MEAALKKEKHDEIISAAIAKGKAMQPILE